VVESGCDIFLVDQGAPLKGKRVALLANPASVSRGLVPTASVLLACGARLDRLFGPQHGLLGDTQANMVEWSGYTEPRLAIPVYSLYGADRSPTREMLEGCEAVVIDLPDVGARPYTYLWTSVLMLRACAAAGVEVFVFDRPNPIGGEAVEGPLLRPEYRSFVGLYPLPMRHGLTIGEALALINEAERIGCRLRVVKMEGWHRSMYYDRTGLPWVLPSPNMPTLDTAIVYPGTVLLEGTNLSEGRGTTRPFEIVGAPWIDPSPFAAELAVLDLPGVFFRPLSFTPTWDKYAGELCGGVQIHVTDRRGFQPVRCGATIVAAAAASYPGRFRWADPPYEYEREKAPIDVICGGPGLREAVAAGIGGLPALFAEWERDERRFEEDRSSHLLY
jgi:uncharacterized protein YbbC (DUF1343 family)